MFRERILIAVLGRARFLPPRIALSIWFRHRLGYWPKLSTPRTFNEKILFRKLYDRNELFGVLCDKLAVRDFVRDRVGDKYLPIVFQVVADPADFDLDALPESFALKANHGWSQHILVPSKSEFSLDDHAARMRRWLVRRHGQKPWALEWAYSQVEPKLFAEEFLRGEGGAPPWDYKFYVYGGRVAYVHVDIDRFGTQRRCFYDRDWQPLEIHGKVQLGKPGPRPVRLDEMIKVAEALGRGLDFVRVDLYDVPDVGVKFGEMTLYPAAGVGRFDSREWELRFGSHWNQVVQ
jgi:hypothetical protein